MKKNDGAGKVLRAERTRGIRNEKKYRPSRALARIHDVNRISECGRRERRTRQSGTARAVRAENF